jgi:hypothetical protein
VFATFNSASCGASEKDERHLHEWKTDNRLASDPHSAAIHGKRPRYAQRNKWNYFRANKVRAIVPSKGDPTVNLMFFLVPKTLPT